MRRYNGLNQSSTNKEKMYYLLLFARSVQFTLHENSLVLWYLTAPSTGRPTSVSLAPLASRNSLALSPASSPWKIITAITHFPGGIGAGGAGKDDALPTNWVINRPSCTAYEYACTRDAKSRNLLSLVKRSTNRVTRTGALIGKSNIGKCERGNASPLPYPSSYELSTWTFAVQKIRLTLPVLRMRRGLSE